MKQRSNNVVSICDPERELRAVVESLVAALTLLDAASTRASRALRASRCTPEEASVSVLAMRLGNVRYQARLRLGDAEWLARHIIEREAAQRRTRSTGPTK